MLVSRMGLIITAIISLLLIASCGLKETVEYNSRSYNSPTTLTAKEFNQKYGQVEPIGDEVNGMEVMLSEKGQSVIEKYDTVPTLLFLKKNEEEYVVYSLQGGP